MSISPNYAALFAASPYPYLLVALDWTIIDANPAYLSAVGRDAGDVLGRPLFDAFPANAADPGSTNDTLVRQSIELAIATKRPHTTAFLRYAVPRATADGVVFDPRYWSTVHTPVLDADGAVAFVCQNAIDVTALYDFDESVQTHCLQERADTEAPPRLQAQNHQALMRILRAERAHLLGLFNQAPGFIAVLRGRNYVFEMANEAYYQLIGHRDILGKPLFDALPDVAGQGFEQLLDRVFSSGEPYLGRGIKFQAQRVPGGPFTEIYIDLLYQPFFEADGVTVSGVFAQGQDVTEINTANLALREADRRKDDFLAMLAHELRNPLAPISAAAELLKIAADDPAKVARSSQIIGRQVRHMSSLVDDLLDVSRVTSGRIELASETVDLVEVIGHAAEQVRPSFDLRAQNFYLCSTADSMPVRGDHKRLVQVIANLLGNASKYSASGGTITVTLERDGPRLRIDVRDDGMGIDPDFLPHVFDLFAQAQRSSARSQGGLGMGLALVKSLVHLHGGTVSAASPGPGQGSCFTILLPAMSETPDARAEAGDPRPEPGPGTEAESVPAPAGAGGLRLLVVDDNIDAADTLADYLRGAGHRVAVAHDSLAALALAEHQDFDACLLDIGLPGIMDGNALAGRLRRLPGAARATLIAISGYGQQSDKAVAARAGFDHYFTKPVSAPALLAELDRPRRAARTA